MMYVVRGVFGLFVILVLVHADVGKSNINFNEQCQALKCNPSTEICRINPKCSDSNQDDSLRCVYCDLRKDPNRSGATKLLASSISQQPLAPRLLAKSNGMKILADSRSGSSSSVTNPPITSNRNKTTDESSYDDYYAYDEEETSDKNNLGEEDEYLDDYAEPVDVINQDLDPIRKSGFCPKFVEATGNCDPSIMNQPDCRFDTDCPADHKCCEAACGKRVCNAPITPNVSICPSTFTCTLNCQLGYRTDSNGCLVCQCQSCPSMEQCNKNCPSGYLKDLFGCDICECSEQCPPFSCDILCSADVGFEKSPDGCPLCQCATTKINPTEYISSCQNDVHCPPGFRCLNDAHNVPICQAVDGSVAATNGCPSDFADTCDLKCSNGRYVLDAQGCPTCACATDSSALSTKQCPSIECKDSCGESGYELDSKGCQTCTCKKQATKDVVSIPYVSCKRPMCRMFCAYGFSRDKDGCEICQCNNSPQPCPMYKCEKTCENGYRKDYSGCATCECQCPAITCSSQCENGYEIDENGCSTCTCKSKSVEPPVDDGCPPLRCDMDCKYGFVRDSDGCQTCSCNRCPLYTCRMFCMYGFKKNSDGCDVCECDWTPVAENIPCSLRIPCTDNRVCNLNLKLCELVSPSRVNWFVYGFEVETGYFDDPKFVLAFKNGLINNIASRYNLEPTQIVVSSVEHDGMTSFQIMPYFSEDINEFQKKMDKIDSDLNTREFRKVLPAVAQALDQDTSNLLDPKWNQYVRKNPRFTLYVAASLIGTVALILTGLFCLVFRQRFTFPGRSESKAPLYDTSYHPAPTEEEFYHAVHAPDGTAYVVVETDDNQKSNEKRVLV